MNDLINLLQRRNLVWQGSEQKPALVRLSTGYSELDTRLNGGFPANGVVQLSSPMGIGEIRLLLPFIKKQQRLLVVINPPGHLCAEQLHHFGCDISQVLVIFPSSPTDALWAAEKCLNSGACGSVLMWQNCLDVHHVRRLQLASEAGDCLLFVLRAAQKNAISLPVTLDMGLFADEQGLQVEIRKRKGGWPLPGFQVDMRQHWPSLTLNQPANVVHFPTAKSM
ncbi:translesion DNA synthesis-associated protein ImuA [Neptunicella sp. SCSIO 80796]|uniref:translesion DNA synthesis-associated protein ImuA n=1 Tax=Neptunicella plasticusilytica TaxID=3117012 RepID=UPI003A4DC355